MLSQLFQPKLLSSLRGYSRQQFGLDLAAGLTVGVLALPLAMAFAIASGCSPSSGIWTAIVAGLLISLLGGSRVQIGGPTGAFIPIVYGIVTVHGMGQLQAATMLAGAILLLMGLSRLGQLIRFIPVTVVIGFTNGIAVVIFLAQIKDFFGLPVAQVPAEFFQRAQVLLQVAPQFDPVTTLLASGCLVFLLLYNRLTVFLPWLARIPGPLTTLVLGTLAAIVLDLPVATIGSRFGGISAELPAPALPSISLHLIGALISPAITIALLGAIESLLSARVADGQIDDQHDPNQELMAQGLANLCAPLFGGIAATGAIARTSTNIRCGGRTPIAGIVHAVVLLLIVVLAAPLAAHVPLAVLAAIVMAVALHMGDWAALRELHRYSWNYRSILLSTFILTVLFDLTIAVEIGMVLACLLFIYRIADLTRLELLPLPSNASPEISAWRLSGSLFFGAVNKIEALIQPGLALKKVLILDLSQLFQLDTSGLEALQNLQRQLHKQGCQLLCCGVLPQPASLMQRSGFTQQLGAQWLSPDLHAALASAEQYLKQELAGIAL
ncbi:SulP family inorganic anion transporter [Chitinibacter tainanensis]|uniref:SulP family inorganic anion transporter n=1 Tax=Chitinibacter tainanensis TaxID=230667 RepID=UPI0023578D96|nr:SulP family inorganic anion transporter [Chitinibacter tainanensis]